MRAAAGAALAAAALLMITASDAMARGDAEVATHGCSVDTELLVRLVRLELASVLDASADPGRYRVAIHCNAVEARIFLSDPLTSKSLERTVLAPASTSPEPERLLALTVAQLYRASWLELIAQEPPPPLDPVVAPSPTTQELASAKKLATSAVEPESPRRHYVSIALLGGLRARHLEEAVLLPNVELQTSWAPTGELYWVSLAAGIEAASIRRTNGALDTLVGSAGAAVTVEPLVAGAWSAFGEIYGGVAISRITARDVTPGYVAGSVLGPGFDGSIGLGGAASIEPLRIELIGRIGLMHGTPAAIVVDGPDLSLDGAWAGVDLRLRWML